VLGVSINFIHHIGFSMMGGEIQMREPFDMDEYERELDKIIANVLPANHPVHERL